MRSGMMLRASTRLDDRRREADYICRIKISYQPVRWRELYREWYRTPHDSYRILHNVNGPAVIFADGTELWYEDGYPVNPQK